TVHVLTATDSQLNPRCGSWPGSVGIPQNVRVEETSGAVVGAAIVKNSPSSEVERIPPMMWTAPTTGTLNAKSLTWPACGTRLYTDASMNALTPPTEATVLTIPICVSVGQFGKVACGHWGTPLGLEIRPGGTSTRTLLTVPSGAPLFRLTLKSVTAVNG